MKYSLSEEDLHKRYSSDARASYKFVFLKRVAL